MLDIIETSHYLKKEAAKLAASFLLRPLIKACN